jgi:hypothetical protein
MGEAKRRKLQTFAQLKTQKCVFCGGTKPAETIDHIPPKVFFINKIRPNSHEVPACERCNSASSGSDQIAALASLTMASVQSEAIPKPYFQKIFQGVRNNQPDAITYLAGLESHPLYQSKLLHMRPYAYEVRVDERIWTKYLNIWAAKQALALYYLATGQSITENGVVYVNWYTNHQLAGNRYPKDLIDLLGNYRTLSNGKFEVSEQFEYRFELVPKPAALVSVMGMHRSAIVFATVFENVNDVPKDSNISKLSAYRTSPSTGIYWENSRA